MNTKTPTVGNANQIKSETKEPRSATKEPNQGGTIEALVTRLFLVRATLQSSAPNCPS